MITLKTLPTATAQEVFDQVANHLLTQMEQSSYEGVCSYSGENGLKCAAGCLISPEEYSPDFEGQGWITLVAEFDFPEQHERLIQSLQLLHDNNPPEEWRKLLQDMAWKYNLELRY